ncbi:MAG TPA: hypothetical protein EYP10_05400, partial [Armatimonadetes bacterium]|nr:hypothetical protein [Armatimonadota bacterium]
IIASRRGAEFVDLEKGLHSINNWVRGTCHYGMMPANGFLYVPPHACVCYINEKLNGFIALAPQIPPQFKSRVSKGASRVERGTAFGRVDERKATADDWVTYRYDSMRTCATETQVPRKLKALWDIKLGGRLTPPIVADGKVFISQIDQHHVIALDANNGKVLWEFTAGGRVNVPPTYYRGMVLFGAADGWVYCVRASDGELIWRFRGAPQDRRVCVYGQLESAHPVNSGVLVQNGIAYFAAGRSSHLDGGIYLYGVDPMTGKLLHTAHVEGPELNVKNTTDNINPTQGALTDILEGDGQLIFMRHLKFDSELRLTSAKERMPRVQAVGGFLDDTYFKRAPWFIGARANWGRLIVANDGQTAYCVRMFKSLHCLDPKNFFTPGKDGYTLLAMNLQNPKKPLWSKSIPVRVKAMVACGKLLWIAGAPDVINPRDPFAAFEGRAGAVLWAFSTESGERVAEYKLHTPPVFNGISAAHGRLYIATRDGRLVCMGR